MSNYKTREELEKLKYKQAEMHVSDETYYKSENVYVLYDDSDYKTISIVVFTKKDKLQYMIKEDKLDSFESIADLYRTLTMGYIKIQAKEKKFIYAELNELLDKHINEGEEKVANM